MEIVINHLTRMRAPRICIAGIEIATDRHIRPTTGPSRPLTRTLLADVGGPFSIGGLVDLGPTTPNPSPPETEDHRFSPNQARLVERLDEDTYAQLLQEQAYEDVETIFGPSLVRHDWNYAVDAGAGDRSLGVLRVQRRPDLTVEESFGKEHVRLRLNDPDKPAYLSVSDLRFWHDDQATARRDVVDDVRRRIRRGAEVILMLGLARAFVAHGDDQKRHWLQVNGICLLDDPLESK